MPLESSRIQSMNVFVMEDKKTIVYGSIVLFLLIIIGYPCPIYTIIGIPCPGCGMTRSLIALIQGDLQKSFYFHVLCIPTIVCAIVYFFNKTRRTHMGIIWCILMIGYYLYRMIVVFPHAPMHPNPHSWVHVFIQLFSLS